MKRQIVVHADDLGLSRSFNAGIRESAAGGLLRSTCLRVNGAAVEEALDEVLPECPGLGVGVHLNLVEGRSTRRSIPRGSPLCYSDGGYRMNFPRLLRGQRDPSLLEEIERDYRDQLDTAFDRLPMVDHLNSHQHSHAVPALFELVCRLSLEYGVPFVRLPREPLYFAGAAAEHASLWYPTNLLKVGVLNRLARKNSQVARRYGVLTNEWLIGIAYTGHMHCDTVLAGLGAVPAGAGVVEVLTHPCRIVADGPERFLDAEVRDYVIDLARHREVDALLDPTLHARIDQRGWQATNYACLSAAESTPAAGAPPPARIVSNDLPRPAPLRVLVLFSRAAPAEAALLRRLLPGGSGYQVVGVAESEAAGGERGAGWKAARLRAQLAKHVIPFGGIDSLGSREPALRPEAVLWLHPPTPGERDRVSRAKLSPSCAVSLWMTTEEDVGSASLAVGVRRAHSAEPSSPIAHRLLPRFSGDTRRRLEPLVAVLGRLAWETAVGTLRTPENATHSRSGERRTSPSSATGRG